jgi:GDP-L-fucose synthase
MQKNDRIYVAGHRGMVGAAICRALRVEGFENIITRTHAELPLDDQAATRAFFDSDGADYVFLAAAKVGGIVANDTYGGDFIRDNLLIQTNVIDSAHRSGVKKLVFLGSSCIYPKHAEQPIREDSLLTGVLEATNEPYAIAKIAGAKMCDAYRRQFGFDAITVMPSNIYGIGDNFDPQASHVVAGMMRRLHEAKEAGAPSVTMWGTGSPLRELTYCDDLGRACVFLMLNHSAPGLINAGSGEEVSIKQLAGIIAEVVGFEGTIEWDSSKPDGTPRKLMDQSRIKSLGWEPEVKLAEGLRRMYAWWTERDAASDR